MNPCVSNVGCVAAKAFALALALVVLVGIPPAGAQVIGDPGQIERISGKNWEMLDGILVVPKNAVLADGWQR